MFRLCTVTNYTHTHTHSHSVLVRVRMICWIWISHQRSVLFLLLYFSITRGWMDSHVLLNARSQQVFFTCDFIYQLGDLICPLSLIIACFSFCLDKDLFIKCKNTNSGWWKIFLAKYSGKVKTEFILCCPTVIPDIKLWCFHSRSSYHQNLILTHYITWVKVTCFVLT